MAKIRGELFRVARARLRALGLAMVCVPALVASSPGNAAERPAELCVPAPGEVVALSAEGLLAAPPIEDLASPADQAPAVLACTERMLVVASPSARGSRLRFFVREGGRWSRRPSLERTLRFLPSRLSIVGETLIAVRDRRGEFELHALPVGKEGRAEVRPLPDAPAALLSGPAEGQLLVAAGESLRSFLLPQVYSREVIPFDEPLVAVARAGDSSLLAISTGRRVFEVDLSDRRSRGRLPVRAETTLPAAATRLFWPEEQGAVAAVLPGAEQVVFLSPVSLTPVRSIDIDAKPLAAGFNDGQVVLALAEGRLQRVRFPELAVVAARPAPAPTRKSAPAKAAGKEKDAPAAAAVRATPSAPPAPEPALRPAEAEPAPAVPEPAPVPAAPESTPPAPAPALRPAEAEPAPAMPEPAPAPVAPESAPAPTAPVPAAPESTPPSPAPALRPSDSEPAPALPEPAPVPAAPDSAPPPSASVPAATPPEPASPGLRSTPASAESATTPPPSVATPQPAGAVPTRPTSEAVPPPPAPQSALSSPGGTSAAGGSERGATASTSGAAPKEPALPRAAAPPGPVSPPVPPASGRAGAGGPPSASMAPGGPNGAAAPAPGPASPSVREDPGAPEPPPPSGPGVLTGRLLGRGELVAEIVILGPDNLLAERARITPVRRDGGLFFLAEGLPPGSYRVQPMGRDGGSLRSQPSFASVRIGKTTGAQVSFTINGSW